MPAGSEYIPVAVLVLIMVGLSAAIMLASHLIGPKRSGPIKDTAYESGVDPIGDARRRFNVRFYLVAVLFVVFDVEVIFLYPWATLFGRFQSAEPGEMAWAQAMSAAGYGPGFFVASMGLFFGLLTLGFIYEWRKGVFRWD